MQQKPFLLPCLYIPPVPSSHCLIPISFPTQRHTAQLREELLKLACPDGLDPAAADTSELCDATAGAEDTLVPEQLRASGSKDLPGDFQL